jgi:exosortase A-associated hydrolase 2
MTKPEHRYDLEPGFLDSAGTALFALCFRPHQASGEAIVFCPPFAEEMNKSRHMMSMAAQRLASIGKTVLIVDLLGTGDSGGEFCDARWDIWKEDIATVLRWLDAGREHSLTLCGLRLGAALALDVAAVPENSVEKVVMWQPVISGSTFMTQFLRLKVAAQLGDAPATVTTEELREQASRGQSLEIAGYDLAPELLAAIDGIDMRDTRMLPRVPVHWLEVVSESRPQPGLLSQKLISAWSDKGVEVQSDVVVGNPFWTTTELSLAPELIEKTCQL